MKINTFVVNGVGDVNECGLRTAGGHRAIGLQDAEEELIQNIDEHRMSATKVMVSRFISFLGNRRLTMDSLKLLPAHEQQRLKKEFAENN